jgi:DNA-binding FadR family transcriptional regulator
MSDANRLTNQIAQTLAGQILSGEWAIGEKLPSDQSLCTTHNVSRTVLREALRVLGAKGLITARPRVGTLVAARADWALWDRDVLAWLEKCQTEELLHDIATDIHDMRLALEPALAALASSRATTEDKQSLQACLRDLQATPTLAHEQAFLRCLYQLSGNQFGAYASHLACWAIAQREAAPPLRAYAALTAAISQAASFEARQCAIDTLMQELPDAAPA